MSSTIFSATSGTSISVDPHADVEGAGQQNPAVPHDAQNGAPAPGNPPNEDLVQAEARLRQMLDTALDRSGGLRGIGGDLYDAIKTEIPRPKVFHGGFRIHSAMLKAANACDVAAANLRRIPIADFHANPLPDAAFAALEAFVGAQNELYTQIGAFQKASGVSAALLDSLAQATQFRASEALNFAATMQLAAMPAERRQQIAPGVADPQAPTAGKAMQDMAHFMHGSGDVAGAFRADAARLFGSIDALEGRKGQMPLAEFRDTATRLRADLEALRGRIDGAIHPNADPGGGPVLIPDRTLFAPAEAMLAQLQIAPNQVLKQMSKGTKEKVQLILAMSRKAKLYLLDEPIGGVDPATRDYILHTILTNYNPEAAVIISTHLIGDVEQVLDEVVFLSRGQIALHDSCEAIREQQGKSVDQLFREVFKCWEN